MPYSSQVIALCTALLLHSHSPFAYWDEHYTIGLLFSITTNKMKAGPQLGLLGDNVITVITITPSDIVLILQWILSS